MHCVSSSNDLPAFSARIDYRVGDNDSWKSAMGSIDPIALAENGTTEYFAGIQFGTLRARINTLLLGVLTEELGSSLKSASVTGVGP